MSNKFFRYNFESYQSFANILGFFIMHHRFNNFNNINLKDENTYPQHSKQILNRLFVNLFKIKTM